jgi:hypothetical protein
MTPSLTGVEGSRPESRPAGTHEDWAQQGKKACELDEDLPGLQHGLPAHGPVWAKTLDDHEGEGEK